MINRLLKRLEETPTTDRQAFSALDDEYRLLSSEAKKALLYAMIQRVDMNCSVAPALLAVAWGSLQNTICDRGGRPTHLKLVKRN